MNDFNIIGIDPGTINFGYSIIKIHDKKASLIECDAIKCSTKESLNNRIGKIFNTLNTVFLKFKPDIVSIEDIFYHKNIKSSITLAHSRAIGLLMSSIYNCRLLEYSPRKVKLSITGKGSADKNEVRRMITRILNISESDLGLDASDACAIALCSYYDILKPFTSSSHKKNSWSSVSLKANGLKIVGGT